jgi:hypothetical protein
MSVIAMHKDLVDTLDSDVMAYFMITLYLHETQLQASDDSLPANEQIETRNEINKAITAVLVK